MSDASTASESEQAAARRSTSSVQWALLVLLLSAAALVRVGLVERMAPQRPEPDAYMLLQYEVFAGRIAREDAPAQFGFYPTLLAQALAAATGAAPFELAAPEATSAEHLAAAARPLVALRTWLAWICVAGVAGVFFLAREVAGSRVGLIATACAACSLLHVVYSHQARPHAAHMTFEVWALYFLLRQLAQPSVLRVLATSVAAWLCMSSLQTGVFLGPALVAAALLSRSSVFHRTLALLAPLAAFGAAQLFQVGGIELSSDGISMASAGHAVELHELNGRGVAPTWNALVGCDPVMFALACVGIGLVVVGAVRARRASARPVAALALAAYALPYFAFALLNEATRDRYLIPLLPFLALLAGLAVDASMQRAKRAAPVVALLALALPIHDAARYYAIARRPDTLEQAAAWLAEQPNATQVRITTSSYVVLPLRYSQAALRHVSRLLFSSVSPWLAYQLRLAETAGAEAGFDLRPFTAGKTGKATDRDDVEARLRQLAPTYIVVEPSRRQRSVPWHALFEQAVNDHSVRVALFEPDGEDPPRDELFEYGDVAWLRARLATARCMGPPLAIYRWNGR